MEDILKKKKILKINHWIKMYAFFQKIPSPLQENKIRIKEKKKFN